MEQSTLATAGGNRSASSQQTGNAGRSVPEEARNGCRWHRLGCLWILQKMCSTELASRGRAHGLCTWLSRVFPRQALLVIQTCTGPLIRMPCPEMGHFTRFSKGLVQRCWLFCLGGIVRLSDALQFGNVVVRGAPTPFRWLLSVLPTNCTV